MSIASIPIPIPCSGSCGNLDLSSAEEVSTNIPSLKCLECGKWTCKSCSSKGVAATCGGCGLEQDSSLGAQLLVWEAPHDHAKWCKDLSGFNSLAETLSSAFVRYADRPCLGTFSEGTTRLDFLRYRDVWAGVMIVRAALTTLLATSLSSRPRVALVCGTRPEWIFADVACLTGGFCSVVLQEKGTVEDLREQLSFCDAAVVGTKELSRVREASPNLPVLCVDELFPNGTLPRSEQVGVDVSGVSPANSPSDIVSIVLTSGTSGTSKGLTLSDTWVNNFIRNPWAYNPLVCLLGFMPWSHQTGRMFTLITFWNGGRGGLHQGNMDLLFQEFKVLSPTMMVSAPRLYDLLRGDFERAMRQESDQQRVREQFSNVFGRRMQVICTGGASTSNKTLQFLRETFTSSFISDGYGASEAGAIAINNRLVAGVEARLLPVDGYDVETERIGELLVKTPTLASGYVGSNSVICDASGFYHTGDIVKMENLGDGTTAITFIDRVANVVKLSQGEFIPLQRLESLFATSPFVSQICVHGTPEMSVVAAIVVAKGGVSQEMIRDDLRRIGLEANLHSYEIPSVILLADEAFTPENNLLTPSYKIKRRFITRKYEDALMKLYAGSQRQLSAQAPSVDDTLVVSEDLRTIFAEISHQPIDTIQADRGFVELGGDSLMAVMFSKRIAERFATIVPSSDIVTGNLTLAQIAVALRDGMASFDSAQRVDLHSEVRVLLEEHLASLKTKPVTKSTSATPPQFIVMTGASGYMGFEVLETVLKTFPDAQVVVLTRRVDRAHDSPRVASVRADLSAPLFGLPRETYDDLAHRTSLVMHIAADTNSLRRYADLRSSNVLSTLEAIKFALAARGRLAYASTSGIVPPTLDESSDLDEVTEEQLQAMNGYSQSKWVAERLVQHARQHCGLEALVFRPGMIGGSLKTPKVNKKDWVFRWIRGCLQQNAFPAIEDSNLLDWASVDYVAEAFVAISTRSQNVSQVSYHLCNPSHKFALARTAELFGRAKAVYPFPEWLARVRADTKSGNEILPLLPMFEHGFPNITRNWTDGATVAELTRMGEAGAQILELQRPFTAEDAARWQSQW